MRMKFKTMRIVFLDLTYEKKIENCDFKNNSVDKINADTVTPLHQIFLLLVLIII